MYRLLAQGVLVVVFALVAGGCGGEAETAAPPAATTPGPPPAAGGAGEEEGVRGAGGSSPAGPSSAGEPVPDIVGTTLDGESISLSDYRGQKVIVHLWSSW
jgi:AhpC/TSA family